MRIEHEEVAAAQGASAARNILGADTPHTEVPYFFSDLADWASLEYVGPALRVGRRGGRGRRWTSGEFAITYREGGRVRAMLSVGGAGDLDRAREEIAAGS